MAIVSKTTRCAVCGSTDVTFSETTKRYHCASCGADEAHAMNAADVAAINSIAALGDTEGKLDELRRRYPASNVVAIDYDPGASEVNQLNRLKLMLSTANKHLKAHS